MLDRAWEIIRHAKRPIILAGNGCIRKRASKQLRLLVEKTGIGVVSTFMAKGCVDMDAEECLYTIGLQSRDFAAIAIEQSDVVITLGYDMVEYHPRLWNPTGDKAIVHIDFLPAEIDENYRTAVEVVGDLAHALWMLNERAWGGLETLSFDHSHTRRARTSMKKDLGVHRNDRTKGRIRPQKAVWDARQVLGPHDILLSDVGAHKMWAARHFQCHEPNTCLIPNGFCSMGFSLPGAIAASLVHPDRRVLAIAGDGAFFMNVQEMETASRLGVSFVVMVWEDKEYGLIKWKQQNQFDGRHTDLAFTNPDWIPFAASLGWRGHVCRDSDKVRPTLEKAFRERGPSLVVIPIDYRENAKLTKRLGNLETSL